MHGQYSFRNISSYLEGGLFVNGDLRENIAAGKLDYLRLEVVYIEGEIYQGTDAHSVLGFGDLGDLFRWPFGAYNRDGYHTVQYLTVSLDFKRALLPFVCFESYLRELPRISTLRRHDRGWS